MIVVYLSLSRNVELEMTKAMIKKEMMEILAEICDKPSSPKKDQNE